MKNERSLQPEPAGRLVTSDRIEGTPLYDSKGHAVAVVEDLMIDPVAGDVHFALVRPASGVAMKPVPWDHLQFDKDRQAYVLTSSSAVLEEAPSLDSGALTDWTDESWNARIRSHYAPNRNEK